MIRDTSSQAVVDQAIFYYELLNKSIHASKAVLEIKDVKSKSYDLYDTKLENSLFNEFNTLSIVYHKPKSHFVYDKSSFALELAYENVDETEETNNEIEEEKVLPVIPDDVFNRVTAPVTNDIMQSIDDVFNTAVAPPVVNDDPFSYMDSIPTLAKTIELINCENSLTPPVFQQKWKGLQESMSCNIQMKNVTLEAIIQNIESNKISRLASGDKGPALQFFFYAQDKNGSLYLISIYIEKQSKNAKIVIKNTTQDNSNLDELFQIIKESLLSC